MASRLAAQMFTLRDYVKTAAELEQTLARVAEIGYTAVQLSGIACMGGAEPEVSAKQARAMLDRLGLRCVATHRDWDSVVNRTEQEIEFHQTLGCDYIAVGAIPGPLLMKGPDGYREMVVRSAEFLPRLKAAGIRWGYHNHSFDFARVDGKRNYDILVEAPADFCLELDTYWVAHAGCCPAALLRKLPGRIPVVHFKDMDVVPTDGVVMAPVGEGNLDWGAIIAACEAGGTEWYCVEQDICRRDPFDCLKSSFTFLSGKGL